MGYVNPNIVKNIYLPLNTSRDDSISLDEYKSKYGIDLRDYFILNPSGDLTDIKSCPNTKLYFAETTEGHISLVNCVYVNEIDENDTYCFIPLSSLTLSFGAGGLVKWTHIGGFTIKDNLIYFVDE